MKFYICATDRTNFVEKYNLKEKYGDLITVEEDEYGDFKGKIELHCLKDLISLQNYIGCELIINYIFRNEEHFPSIEIYNNYRE